MHQAQAILADPKLLKALQQLVHQAGEAIMQVYQTANFGIEPKKMTLLSPRQTLMHTIY